MYGMHLALINHDQLLIIKKLINFLFFSLILVGEFAHKVAALKEQLGNQLLSVVESFRKKNSEMKKDRCGNNNK